MASHLSIKCTMIVNSAHRQFHSDFLLNAMLPTVELSGIRISRVFHLNILTAFQTNRVTSEFQFHKIYYD